MTLKLTWFCEYPRKGGYLLDFSQRGLEFWGMPRYSVIVRTFNEERYIGELLECLVEQKEYPQCEIIVIDSESTDSTCRIVERFKGVQLVHLKKGDFSYGRALNRAISLAQGEIIVSISAHCVPISNVWLSELGKQFEDESIAIVAGRQVGIESVRKGHPSTRFSERRIFEKVFPSQAIPRLGYPFLNNANSAFRRSWWERFPFCEELPGLEDLDFAKKVYENGGFGAYCASATVLHLHDENNYRVFQRFLREELALKKICSMKKRRSAIALEFIRDYASDLLHVASVNELYSRYFITITGYRLAQYFAVYLAHYGASPGALVDKIHNRILFSLTKGRTSIQELRASRDLRTYWG